VRILRQALSVEVINAMILNQFDFSNKFGDQFTAIFRFNYFNAKC
jgi:hypothetical protein